VIQTMMERARKARRLRVVFKPGYKNNSQVKGMGDKAVFRSGWLAALPASQLKKS